MGLEPTISCLGSKRSTTELHPRTPALRCIAAQVLFAADYTAQRVSMVKTATAWKLASVALTDAYTDFILSRQAMNCSFD
jgi:hypothetical protein